MSTIDPRHLNPRSLLIPRQSKFWLKSIYMTLMCKKGGGPPSPMYGRTQVRPYNILWWSWPPSITRHKLHHRMLYGRTWVRLGVEGGASPSPMLIRVIGLRFFWLQARQFAGDHGGCARRSWEAASLCCCQESSQGFLGRDRHPEALLWCGALRPFDGRAGACFQFHANQFGWATWMHWLFR